MAKVTGAKLLHLLRAEADRVADIASRLAEAVDTATAPAVEAEVEAVRAAEADHWRADTNAAS